MVLSTPFTIRTRQRNLSWKAKPESGSRDMGACLLRKNIGKPCRGKPYARFDEGALGYPLFAVVRSRRVRRNVREQLHVNTSALLYPHLRSTGKPCVGQPHARFDEGGLATVPTPRLLRHRQTKGAETNKPGLQDRHTSSLLYPKNFPVPNLRLCSYDETVTQPRDQDGDSPSIRFSPYREGYSIHGEWPLALLSFCCSL